MTDEPTAENEKLKLCHIGFTSENTDGINVQRRDSTVRGETLEECLKYTRLLHNQEKH